MTHDEDFWERQIEEAKAAAFRAYDSLRHERDARRRAEIIGRESEAALFRARLYAAHARMEANARKRGAPTWIPQDWFYNLTHIAWARRDVPGTRIRRGDVITYRRRSDGIPGLHVIRCTRDELEVLRATELSDYVRHVELIVDPPQRYGHPLPGLLDRRKWGRRKNGTLFAVVRPVRPETIGTPTIASSDDAAIFELLHDVGCRMPR